MSCAEQGRLSGMVAIPSALQGQKHCLAVPEQRQLKRTGRGTHEPEGACYQGVFAAGSMRGSGDAGRRKSQLRDALTPRFNEGEMRIDSERALEGAEAFFAPNPRRIPRPPRIDTFEGFEGSSAARPTRRRTDEHGIGGRSPDSGPASGAQRCHTEVASERLSRDATNIDLSADRFFGGYPSQVARRNDAMLRPGLPIEDSLEGGLRSPEGETQAAVDPEDQDFAVMPDEVSRSDVERMQAPMLPVREDHGPEGSQKQTVMTGINDIREDKEGDADSRDGDK
jgi:hypothetical protein